MPILSLPVLVSDPSKSGTNTAVAVAAAINKPDIELKEAEDNGGGDGIEFMVYAGSVFGGLLLVGGGTVLFMESMTNMERRRGAKLGDELTERRKEISAKAKAQELRISVDDKTRSSGSISEPIMCLHASDLGIKSVYN